MTKKNKEAIKIAGVNFDISNSGVSFTVQDEGNGPTIKIRSSAFGNLQNEVIVFTNSYGLKLLGKMFLEASKYDSFTDDYCHAATPTSVYSINDEK